ncbi:MAG: DUF134 domain-containing protein [Candidatus Omnitrophica bacterium]|nr:DUF134 domain-containing protein [Candidatus Omnitrophota bacterium]
MPRGRPKKQRKIQKEPSTRQFSPRGRIGRPGYVTLGFDEFEALRLADFLGYSQKEAAKSMKVSQQTFSRVLKRARKTIAEGISLGLIINIKPSGKGEIKGKKKPLKRSIKPA